MRMNSGLLGSILLGASLVVKNLTAMQQTLVRSQGQEDPLEKSGNLLLPGESHGQRSLVGYGPWDCKEPDKTE